MYFTMKSSSSSTPISFFIDVAKTGITLPFRIASRNASVISASLISLPSKYLLSRVSFTSTTASINWSLNFFNSGASFSGLSIRLLTDFKSVPIPTGLLTSRHFSPNTSRTEVRISSKLTFGISSLVMIMALGTLRLVAWSHILRVLTIMPEAAFMATKAASTADSPEIASAAKSGYPGVSMMLRFLSFHLQ